MSTALVVGAGPCGLGAATALASHMDVHVIDRIPVAGGEAGWRSSSVRKLVRRAEKGRVHFRLGVTALRWDGQRLLLAAPGDIGWHAADLLVFAGGRRPGTAADLRLVGDRPSGVVAATVAEHLLSTGVALWRAPLIIGAGRWAAHVSAQLKALRIPVTALVPPVDESPWADTRHEATGRIEVIGRERVEAVRVAGPSGSREIRCDAVILNGRGVPNRNIDGALSEGSANVLFAQPLDEESTEGRYWSAYHTATHWLSEQGERS
jgi:hypothetical protein